MHSIYVIHNIQNDKVYVGQSKDPKSRLAHHKRSLRRGDHYNPHLQRSWDVHLEAAFEFYILESGISSDDIDGLEIFYISWYRSLELSYNISDGGDVKRQHSEETKEKIRQSKLGVKRSPETIQKMVEGHRGVKRTPEHLKKLNGAWRGQHHSEEARKKIGEANSRRIQTDETKQKIREAHLGKKRGPHSEETRQKMSLASKGKPISEKKRLAAENRRGRKYTEEQKQHIREAREKTFFLKAQASKQLQEIV